jgi:hypothetical protein
VPGGVERGPGIRPPSPHAERRDASGDNGDVFARRPEFVQRGPGGDAWSRFGSLCVPAQAAGRFFFCAGDATGDNAIVGMNAAAMSDGSSAGKLSSAISKSWRGGESEHQRPPRTASDGVEVSRPRR